MKKAIVSAFALTVVWGNLVDLALRLFGISA